VQSGAYASASEVVRAAVRALDRRKAQSKMATQAVDEAFADPSPSVPADEVFKPFASITRSGNNRPGNDLRGQFQVGG